MASERREPYPGMHTNFAASRFSTDEQIILNKLKREWFLTNSGSKITLAASSYDFFLMKPTKAFSEMFNVEREIICVFSAYERFEPRTLDAFDYAQRRLSDLRIESVCRVLISKDNDIEKEINKILKTDPEQPIVIPFSYSELMNSYDNFFIRNKFRKHFYTRDLYSFLSPLKKDLYFFGRSELIQEIVNRHRSAEHTGLFGLRKSGKTSIIYAVERHLASNGELFLSFDCESPSIHKLRWNEFLLKIAKDFKEKLKSRYKIVENGRYNEKNAADSFTEDIVKIHTAEKVRSILLLFDEIERISPDTGSSQHWRKEEDFIYFWQSLRGFYQRTPNILTYMIVGTNPNCVEQATIFDHENPLFASIPSHYVPPFDLNQVKQMVRKLGRFMGINYDELIYGKLTDDFGGHPFLIRQMCSYIHQESKGDRPINVDKALYHKMKRQFTRKAIEYLQMIIKILQEWYPEEYDMLCFLAQDDQETFEQFALDHERYTKHLIGYGLIQYSDNGFSFNIESIRDLLSNIHKYEKLNLTSEEKIAEISIRRNNIEKGLRILCKNTLTMKHGKKKAGEKVIASLPLKRRDQFQSSEINELLHQDKSPLFFLDLKNLISREWEAFPNVFDMEKDRLEIMLSDINKYGRPDAHAKFVKKDEFIFLRLHFKKLEAILSDWTYIIK